MEEAVEDFQADIAEERDTEDMAEDQDREDRDLIMAHIMDRVHIIMVEDLIGEEAVDVVRWRLL